MIPDSFIQELKYHSDVEQVISSYVPLKRAGRNLKGLCPFHSEKTPSFTVYPDSQSFYCFGCGAGGDVVTFVKRVENLEYIEALRLLADRAGMTLPEDGMDDSAARLKTRVLEINRESARFFYQMLYTPRGASALEYFHQRGLSDRTIRHFGLGWSPDGWEELKNHLLSKGFSLEELSAASVIARSAKGSYYDLFRGRVMFPIIDLRGAVIGFGGRAMGDRGPKYLNSPDTPVFKKSRNLFALNFAKKSSRQHLILGEGYMDVIAMHQAGFDNAVATLGTALTPEQSRLITQYTAEVIIAYDSDGAGQNAAKRAIKLFDETGVKVRVLTITGAKDPDEFIKKFGAGRFEQLLSGSENAIEYGIENIRRKYDVESSDGKVTFLKEFCSMMAGLHNPIERDVYISRICTEVGVEKEAMNLQVEALTRQRNRAKEKKEAADLRIYAPPERKIDPERQKYQRYAVAEEKLIVLLMRHPDCFDKVARRLTPQDMVTETNRRIYSAIYNKRLNGLEADMISLSSVLDEGDLSKLSWLLASESSGTVLPEAAEDLINAILKFHTTTAPGLVAGLEGEELRKYISNLAAEKKRGL